MDFARISSNPQSLLRAISPLPSTWRSTFDLMSFSLLQNEKKISTNFLRMNQLKKSHRKKWQNYQPALLQLGSDS